MSVGACRATHNSSLGGYCARSIESCLHWVRDVTLGEDACRVRKGSAPQVLAALRNAAVHLLAGVEADSRVAATERLSARPDEALRVLLESRTALDRFSRETAADLASSAGWSVALAQRMGEIKPDLTRMAVPEALTRFP